MLGNILILSASTGAGHGRAGEALERAFLETGAARTVKHLDTLEYTNPLFRALYSKAISMLNGYLRAPPTTSPRSTRPASTSRTWASHTNA
jgi:hypothetical protein